MSIIQKILSLFGQEKKSSMSLQEEVAVLNQYLVKSLQSGTFAACAKPEEVLEHTGKVKEIIQALSDNGQLKADRKTIDYALGNIQSQENMIKTGYAGYKAGDLAIYNSIVGNSISEILKEIRLFVN